MSPVTLVVIAKDCLPGRVKTRLHPPFALDEAARLAAASLADTVEVVAGIDGVRRLLFFDGSAAAAERVAPGFAVLHQPAGSLDERLAHLFDALPGPLLLVGMDTPQLQAADLAPALAAADEPVDAWFGPAEDGGFWALGMREPRGDLLRGVPMSTPGTGRIQLERLRDAGLRVGILPTLRDVDTAADAHAVAEIAPHGSFARVLSGLQSTAAVPA